jgi:hypothetical protein
MFDPQELEQMRQDVLDTLVSECQVVYEGAEIPDGEGGRTRVEDVSGPFPCRIDPISRHSDRVLVQQLQLQTRITYRLTMAHDAPLDIGARVDVGGERYEVAALEVGHTANVARRAIISALR